MVGFVITTSFVKLKSGLHALCGKSEFSIASLPRSNGVIRVLLCLAAMVFWCGCIPLRFTTSPGASGTIVDASTRAPLDGAEVVISRSTYPPESPEKAFSNGRSPKVMSHENGGFTVPAERRVDLYCVPADVFPRFGLLVIKHQGYATTCVPFWSHSISDLGQIAIQPARE
jgi:hypothetical protein